MKTYSLPLALLLIGLLPSCVSTKNIPLSSTDRATIHGKSVAVTSHPMPSWGVIKPETMVVSSLTGGIGGAIAGSVAENQGNKEIKKHGIKDPAEKIADTLEAQLIKDAGAKRFSKEKIYSDKNDSKEVAALIPNADYILDVRTTGWMGMYYPMTFSKYKVLHNLQMRLIEQKTGKVIAQGFSAYQGDDKDNAPNFDGIYSNGASFLKQELKKSSDKATGIFKSQL
ncbi:MAG: hypothetical protein V4727_09925 [Verrucomicrobiota bacterium]